jgi:hypothetical protein
MLLDRGPVNVSRARLEVRRLATDRAIVTRTLRSGAGALAFAGNGVLVASECCSGGAFVSSWDPRSGARHFRRKLSRK